MVVIINARNMSDAYEQIFYKLYYFGEDIRDTLEIQNMIIYIKNFKFEVPQAYFFKGNLLEKYIEQFLNPINTNQFEYTYGSRIFNPDQYKQILKKIKHNPDTRQAIIHLWRVDPDYARSVVPCMQTIQYLIRDGKIHTTVTFRSNDMGNAWVGNMGGVYNLTKKLAKDTGYTIGSLTSISTSTHIYKTEIDLIHESFKNNRKELRP